MAEYFYSSALDDVLKKAQQEAISYGITTVSTEHLLCALVEDPTISSVLRDRYKTSTGTIQADLADYFGKLEHDQDQTLTEDSITTLDSNVVELLEQAQDFSGQGIVDVIDLLNAVIAFSRTPGAAILRVNGVNSIVPSWHDTEEDRDVHDHTAFMASGIAGDPSKNTAGSDNDDTYDVADVKVDMDSGTPKITYKKRRRNSGFMPRTGGKFLQEYCHDLNAMAQEGQIGPAIGRKIETDQMIEALGRRRKNNPMLLGEPGVGKTAIAEDLAYRIVTGDAPASLRNKTVYALDLGRLLAGTTYRGDFEKRITGILDDIREDGDVILVIDEIHMLVGLGSGRDSSNDASNFLKPALQRGDLRCIGTTTYDDYRKYILPDKALGRRFQRIDVDAPTSEQTVDILRRSIRGYADHHRVAYADEALRAAVVLGDRFFPQQQHPDKAFDIIDAAGARKFLDMQEKASLKRGRVTARDITACVARMKKMPITDIQASDRDRLRNLESDLKENVFDQDEAATTLAHAVRMARSGLNNPDKPVGSFLFQGPTGVGKTEAAKQLAKTLGLELIRFDMSEYMDENSASRLIGAPPGYVGFDQGGLLTEALDRKPRAVLLLDEIEKAHPKVYNILLQAMDHGTVTDNNGKKADFRHAIIIMTTNAGSAEAQQNSIGFTSANNPQSRVNESVARVFTPEFRNRLDATVNFRNLTQSTIEKVAEKFLRELRGRAQAQKVTLEWTDAARVHLAKIGFDPLMGARPMERKIKETVGTKITDEILGRKDGKTVIPGKLENGGTVLVDFNDAASGLAYTMETRKLRVVKKTEPLPKIA